MSQATEKPPAKPPEQRIAEALEDIAVLLKLIAAKTGVHFF